MKEGVRLLTGVKQSRGRTGALLTSSCHGPLGSFHHRFFKDDSQFWGSAADEISILQSVELSSYKVDRTLFFFSTFISACVCKSFDGENAKAPFLCLLFHFKNWQELVGPQWVSKKIYRGVGAAANLFRVTQLYNRRKKDKWQEKYKMCFNVNWKWQQRYNKMCLY